MFIIGVGTSIWYMSITIPAGAAIQCSSSCNHAPLSTWQSRQQPLMCILCHKRTGHSGWPPPPARHGMQHLPARPSVAPRTQSRSSRPKHQVLSKRLQITPPRNRPEMAVKGSGVYSLPFFPGREQASFPGPACFSISPSSVPRASFVNVSWRPPRRREAEGRRAKCMTYFTPSPEMSLPQNASSASALLRTRT